MLRLSKRTIYFSITPPVTEYAERRRVCLAAESVPLCLRAEVSLPHAVPFDAVFFFLSGDRLRRESHGASFFMITCSTRRSGTYGLC